MLSLAEYLERAQIFVVPHKRHLDLIKICQGQNLKWQAFVEPTDHRFLLVMTFIAQTVCHQKVASPPPPVQ
jgi:hypothetical protein